MSYQPSNRRGGGGGGRRGYGAKSSFSDSRSKDNDLLSIRDIQHHFWKSDHEGMTSFGEHATLNNSAAAKHGLGYVLLFRNANPRWKSDGIIFVKSNLDILPDYFQRTEEWYTQYPREIIEKLVPEPVTTSSRMTRDVRLELEEKTTEEAPPEKPEKPSLTELAPIPPLDFTPSNAATPIAVFEQIGTKQSGETFKFAGWFTIQHIAIIAPYSEPLKRLLAQKWQSDVDTDGQVIIKPRDEQRWRQSFEQEWAVVKFVLMNLEEEGTPPALIVEKAPPRKSVNDLLAEMRLGKDGEAIEKTDSSVDEGKDDDTKEKIRSGIKGWNGYAGGGYKQHDTDLRAKLKEEMDRLGEKQTGSETKQESSKNKEPEGKENETSTTP